jgi:hypothetical protein
MNIEIYTLKELIAYVQTNYDKLTDSQFQRLLNSTLFIYPRDKPKTLNEAIKMITYYGNIPIGIRPLFPDINQFDEH